MRANLRSRPLKLMLGCPCKYNNQLNTVPKCDFYYNAPQGWPRSSLLETLKGNTPPFPRWHQYIAGLILMFNTCLKAFKRQEEYPVMGNFFSPELFQTQAGWPSSTDGLEPAGASSLCLGSGQKLLFLSSVLCYLNGQQFGLD